MARYVDGFVLMVPKKSLAAYKEMAAEGGRVWKKFGAVDYKECVIDDEKPMGVVVPFRTLVGAKPGETVLFSFITFRSKKERDRINAKVMAYFDKKFAKKKDMAMPFAMNRMSVAGFKVFVDRGV